MTVRNHFFLLGHMFSKNKPVLVYFCRDQYIKCIKSLAICNEEMRQKVTREVNSLRMHIFDSYNEDKKNGKTDVPNWLAKAVDEFYLR